MDEIEAAIMGQIDRWRVERRNAYYQTIAAAQSQNPPTMFELLPLAHDDELQGPKTNAEQLEEYYKSVTSQWN